MAASYKFYKWQVYENILILTSSYSWRIEKWTPQVLQGCLTVIINDNFWRIRGDLFLKHVINQTRRASSAAN